MKLYKLRFLNWLYGKRHTFFINAFAYLRANKIKGDYAEFGVYTGKTFIMAYKYSRYHKLDLRLHGFDSFKGLPESEGVFKKGDFSISKHLVIWKLLQNGLKKNDFKLYEGLFCDFEKINSKELSFIFIDCDLYTSTVDALKLVTPFIKKGLLIAFDDWLTNYPIGEPKAFYEWVKKNNIKYTEFNTYDWHMKAFIIK